MTSLISTTLQLPTTMWPMAFARVEGFAPIAVNVTKRNRHHAQGCFPMTD